MEFENLLALIKAVSDSELTELKYEENSVKIKLSKKQEMVQEVAQTVAQAVAQTPVQTTTDCGGESHVPAQALQPEKIVESPLVGVFYTAPARDAKPFVTVGDKVEKGQTLAIVEAMKLMNEIESEYSGTIAEVYVENGQPVEYGQPLFRIH